MTSSADLYRRAMQLIPGGVSSPARAFGAVHGDPIFAARAEGAYLHDADGRAYVDYIQGFGAVILGHAHPAVAEAVVAAAARGATVGLSTSDEVELASLIVQHVPCVEKVRFVVSGTEAGMTAARLARAATGRRLVVKAEGCYHGHSDAFLAAAGSGMATFAIPAGAGVPQASVADTAVVAFNDAEAIEKVCVEHGDDIACVILEPIAANMGVVAPEPGYLERVQNACRAAGALLVADEVVTGFRVAMSGAQGLLGFEPDLTMLGKVVGGGLPVGVVGGRAELMDMIAPQGSVYQGGTYAAHPHAMAAGLAALRELDDAAIGRIEATARALEEGVRDAIAEAGARACVVRERTILCVYFREDPPRNFVEAQDVDREGFARFHRALRDAGVLIPPSPFEAWFPSLAHTDREVAATLQAVGPALRAASGASRV